MIYMFSKFMFVCLVYQAVFWYFGTKPPELPVLTGSPDTSLAIEPLYVNGTDYSIMEQDLNEYCINGTDNGSWTWIMEICVKLDILSVNPIMWFLRFQDVSIYNHANGIVKRRYRTLKPMLLFRKEYFAALAILFGMVSSK